VLGFFNQKEVGIIILGKEIDIGEVEVDHFPRLEVEREFPAFPGDYGQVFKMM
jgi:hypothetical protein